MFIQTLFLFFQTDVWCSGSIPGVDNTIRNTRRLHSTVLLHCHYFRVLSASGEKHHPVNLYNL